MNIIWNMKPAAFDTRNITRMWFEKSTVVYCVGNEKPRHAKMRDIQIILVDSAYALTGRNLVEQPPCTIKTFGLPCSKTLGHDGPCRPVDTREGKNY